MIEQMRLRDLGVIASATLPIGPGFTAITGETGAGKTMVVTGLGLLLGQRADSGAVRAGAEQASVDGVWVVPESGAVVDRVRDAGGDVEPNGDGTAELYLGRTLSSEGRSRATVGGRTAPAGVLADLADHLVVVHGQSDQLRLKSAAAQRDALDRFGGDAIAGILADYRALWDAWRSAAGELETLTAEQDARAREAGELRDAIAAIEAVDPQPDEDLELGQRADRLANAEELRLAAVTAHEALSSEDDQPDVQGLLGDARRALERAASSDATLQMHAASLEELGYRVADVAGELSSYLADLDEGGPHELAAVEERRSAIGGLIRAHGSLAAAIDLLATGSARLAELDDDSDRIERLTAERDRLRGDLDRAGEALSQARREAASRLGEAVTEELRHLALPDAQLTVAVEPGAEAAHGRDDVTILLAPHPGASPRPVARGASGGELSRVMLAIEVVIAGTDPVPTFVFDEVDAGIGGAAAIEVGRRLAKLAETSQVIAVTHLAQVAAFAGNHLTVVKANDGSVTASSVRRLDGADRAAEMARLLSGMADSDAALDHARELLALGGAH
ncbi:DNA repair protein RecN [Microbacterium sp. EYE_5]|uniref:DNA repair protein RecN n=1 Tax=unclassified Microbacterium TaxID=2609290 RepID=UPI0020060172|nr:MULTISPECIES: DNA repair protein RecN [unclassified Microbacterium]MCK6080388.1 DNA repair protein RecN [Microbacterium sp. EYE_382]MCK6085659.1 DNA repair protein RecN [Microbacterium sp. EYE_384]MCK6124843.1 DNA repair protein RecN [Microbacterium sp. EYE_80]MCK6127752.1 DNA repair protein RecN [Microbacterium sp. EYE_79]MCK6141343.1 DNA repair protein RecN [Microbacterium sp. EYE_39]